MTISPFRGPNRFPLPAPSPPTRAASNKSPVKSEQVEADRSVEAPRSSGHPISTAALKYLDGDVFPNGGSLVGPNARAPAEVPGKPVNNNDPDDRSRHKQSQEPTGLGDSDALRQPAVLRRQLLSRRETLDTRALLYDNSIMVEESVIRTTETSLTVFVCGLPANAKVNHIMLRFSRYGEIRAVIMSFDRGEASTSKGSSCELMARVSFRTREAVVRALKVNNTVFLGSRVLVVDDVWKTVPMTRMREVGEERRR